MDLILQELKCPQIPRQKSCLIGSDNSLKISTRQTDKPHNATIFWEMFSISISRPKLILSMCQHFYTELKCVKVVTSSLLLQLFCLLISLTDPEWASDVLTWMGSSGKLPSVSKHILLSLTYFLDRVSQVLFYIRITCLMINTQMTMCLLSVFYRIYQLTQSVGWWLLSSFTFRHIYPFQFPFGLFLAIRLRYLAQIWSSYLGGND